MNLKKALSTTLALCLVLFALPLFATDIHEVPGGVAMVDLGFAITGAPGSNGTFFLGDILLCDPGATCASDYTHVDLSVPGADTGISDVLRFVDKGGEAFAFLYDEPYWESQPSFLIYGTGDLAIFTAAGFAVSGDNVAMGNNSGTTIPETPPVTVYSGSFNIFSTEAPEPSTVSMLAVGSLGLAGSLRRKLRR